MNDPQRFLLAVLILNHQVSAAAPQIINTQNVFDCGGKNNSDWTGSVSVNSFKQEEQTAVDWRQQQQPLLFHLETVCTKTFLLSCG